MEQGEQGDRVMFRDIESDVRDRDVARVGNVTRDRERDLARDRERDEIRDRERDKVRDRERDVIRDRERDRVRDFERDIARDRESDVDRVRVTGRGSDTEQVMDIESGSGNSVLTVEKVLEVFRRISSVNTPTINSQLALPFKKRPVKDSSQFKKEYVEIKNDLRKVSGSSGKVAYQEEQERRKSLPFNWPNASPDYAGMKCNLQVCRDVHVIYFTSCGHTLAHAGRSFKITVQNFQLHWNISRLH